MVILQRRRHETDTYIWKSFYEGEKAGISTFSSAGEQKKKEKKEKKQVDKRGMES